MEEGPEGQCWGQVELCAEKEDAAVLFQPSPAQNQPLLFHSEDDCVLRT